MYIADLHIHSRFSRATSREGDLPHLEFWARRKGISLVGTGDFTHPQWREELREQLVPAEEGLYALREDCRLPDPLLRASRPVRFVLSSEISSIYKKNGKTRKVHNVILLPDLEAAEALSARLEQIGNIRSDGRPILGLDSRDLLEITLETCADAIFIPAHIWTPHFSLFGAFSGFDTIEECFEDLTPHIHALETGLSSDPPMNWRVSALDRFTLVSHSDAHSPQKLGREADLLDTTLSYPALKHALETGDGFAGTLEFFPEEGKYHLDGHRNCGVCLSPQETIACGGRCPVCGKKLTIGVEHRVEELADRPAGFRPAGARPFESLAPLPEVIAASTGLSAAGKRANEIYETLLSSLGPEFHILREAPLADVEQAAGSCIAEGLRRLRAGQVVRDPGYDGAYGTVSLLSPEEIEQLNGQVSLFGAAAPPAVPTRRIRRAQTPPAPAYDAEMAAPLAPPAPEVLNEEQARAVTAAEPAVAVIAGPGTGKTKTLVARIAWLVEAQGVSPGAITAVTFTNLAAAEMRQRLETRLGKHAAQEMAIGTFHSLCLDLLGQDVRLLSEPDAWELAESVLSAYGLRLSPRRFLRQVSAVKNGVADTPDPDTPDGRAFALYQDRLRQEGVFDFDDLLLQALERETTSPAFAHLLVDEFQDINALQYRLIRQWSAGGRSLFVIGDPDQSIYGFRGADAGCFDRLQADLPGLVQIRLVHNYRSTPEILACALPAISRNPGGARQLLARRPSGVPVRLLQADTEFAEAVGIAKEIGRLAGGVDMLEARDHGRETRSFSDMAVLCRTHRQQELIERCLRHDSLPCIVSGREDYLEDRAVRGILGFFRFLLDCRDRLSLQACLLHLWNCPRPLVDSLLLLCRDAADPGDLRRRAAQAGLAEEPLRPFWEAVDACLPTALKEKPQKLLDRLWEGRESTAPVGRLRQAAGLHRRLPEFLRTLLLGQEADVRRADGKSYAAGAVRVMTLHGAKGLEFPVVFLFGLTRGALPLESPGRQADPEEERRLFFVGLTRARDELLLTTSGEPSPFLAELPDETYRHEALASFRREPEPEQLSLF